MLGISILFVSYLIALDITDLIHLDKLEEEAEIVYARIVDRDLGLLTLKVNYKFNDIKYKKTLQVGKTVYRKHKNKDTIKLRVLKNNPKVVTWEGDRTDISSKVGLAMLFPVIAVMIFVFIGLIRILYQKR